MFHRHLAQSPGGMDSQVGQLAYGRTTDTPYVADRRFPRNGNPEAVRKHLSAMQAEGDMFAAVDDAESDWLSA
ncbi:hypothetical protein [Sphingomonas sp. LR55]|uniref:hypothetical protein n=1 Tax=Sphingomonas sp. LR55 TaxID=3050231 RepID=UPI002FE21289